MGSASNHPKIADHAAVAVAGAGDGDSNASDREAKMAADIAELRSIVLAAAKHFKVDIPSDTPDIPSRPSSPDSAFRHDLARMLADIYDEDATVRHRVFLAPTGAMLGASQWRFIFGLEPPRSRVTIGPHSSRPLDSEGEHTLAEWQLNPLMSKNVHEYGYTADGRFFPLSKIRPNHRCADHVVSRGCGHGNGRVLWAC